MRKYKSSCVLILNNPWWDCFLALINSKNLGSNEVKSDEGILTDVFTRLMDNAVKFSDKESEIKVSSEKSNNGISVSIENTGKKIDSSKIESLLPPFTLDEKALNHSKGTGLGLSICQAQLKLLNQTIQISANDNTTKISFEL